MIGYFKYNGKYSTDFDLVISESISFSSPQIRGGFEEVLGVDGELFLTDKKLKNVPKKFHVLLLNKSVERISEISNWLKSSYNWSDLETSIDPDYIYKAIFVDEYDFDSTAEDYDKAVLSFVLKPYKFLKTGQNEITLGTNIINPTNRPSRPKITIKGSGNITLKIGSALWEFKNISGGIIVDTLLDVVTTLDGKSLAWDKTITYPLPRIASGTQTVTKTGNITDVKIIPNWEVIV